MNAIYSPLRLFVLIFSFTLAACSSKPAYNSKSANLHADTSSAVTQPPDSTQDLATQKNDLTRIYSQAIGDYIRLVKKEYNLTFDTLFFGKHVYGQPDDFPDIALPNEMENTVIKLITPEEGKKKQEENKFSYYINLFGWVDSDKAEFTFVTFSNGMAHQFDGFIQYQYDRSQQGFSLANSRFENFLYKRR